MMDSGHVAVLYKEVLQGLLPRPGGKYIDGTVGAGGHASGILENSAPGGRLLAFDQDPEALDFARQRLAAFGERVTFVNANFADMGRLAPEHGFEDVDGVLLDLGLSSRQLENPERGFSFQTEGPLDMRFSPAQTQTAADLINNLDEHELADLFWRFGEERNSRRIARAIVNKRPLGTTAELVQVIEKASPRRGRKHPATLVFQALRIAVNQELAMLEQGLAAALDLLRPGGRLAIISFHSLEDRYVKHTFRDLERECICPPELPICTCDAHAQVRLPSRRAIQPTVEEVERNPRSRSAKLRIAEKLAAPAG
jgi:16S rRNA (cytosine1402-N4)-methyltransferase